MDDLRGSITFELFGVVPYYNDADRNLRATHIGAPYIQSPVFTAGGYYWRVRLYPTNCFVFSSIGCFSVSLQLVSSNARARAAYELSVLDCSAILPPRSLSTSPPQYFASDIGGADNTNHFSGAGMDLDKTYLYDSCAGYIRDSRLLFQCTVTVSLEDPHPTPPPPEAYAQSNTDVPPSDMLGQLGEVLRTREGADVTFFVKGELIPAHKIILAMRSPVFKAELYGEMKEDAAQPIVVDDMRADTFRALLRYLYTDALPTRSSDQDQDASSVNSFTEDVEGDSETGEDDKVLELLKAADRYDVGRLKLICEGILCKRIHVENVADMLVLADRHLCDTLKDACVRFMTTSHRMNHVALTQGYMQLKSTHPHLLFEVLEKSSRFHKCVLGYFGI